MATNKQINQLPAGTSVTDTSFFADEDSSNANITQKLSGLQLYNYVLLKGVYPVGTVINTNFNIPNATSTGGTPPQTWIIASGFPGNDVTISLPSGPGRGEIHQFIVSNSGHATTIQPGSPGTFVISGNLLILSGGFLTLSNIVSQTSLHTSNTSLNYQVCTLMFNGIEWVLLYNVGFTN